MNHNIPKNLYTDPDEVSVQVETFAYLLGQLDDGQALGQNSVLGLYLIGNMISSNVDAMIADFEDRISELKAAKEGSGEA